ncbi:hypothetical protein WAI453_013698 [Rhynchosporium graminicola]
MLSLSSYTLSRDSLTCCWASALPGTRPQSSSPPKSVLFIEQTSTWDSHCLVGGPHHEHGKSTVCTLRWASSEHDYVHLLQSGRLVAPVFAQHQEAAFIEYLIWEIDRVLRPA